MGDIILSLFEFAHKLNAEAKSRHETNISYSIRESGAIWKFMKNSEAKWVRDADWKLPSGNDQ